MLVRYRTQPGDFTRTMLPSGHHTVDEHGTIHAPVKGPSKKERNKLRKQGINFHTGIPHPKGDDGPAA